MLYIQKSEHFSGNQSHPKNGKDYSFRSSPIYYNNNYISRKIGKNLNVLNKASIVQEYKKALVSTLYGPTALSLTLSYTCC